MKLIVVESPTKAKTLQKFLGSEYKIEASMGHLRDLPKSKLGVDVENKFEPVYEVGKGKNKYVTVLKKVAKDADQIILATDLDREGEAIAWHVKHLLTVKNKKRKFTRIVFHEITKKAISEALSHQGEVDLKLVHAQESRRILDRLVGYKLSPVLWRKVRRGLSAGRVQSVAVKLIVEREELIKAFKPEEFWEIIANLKKDKDKLEVKLTKIDSKKLDISSKEQAEVVEKELKEGRFIVSQVGARESLRRPVPPFMTSILQRTAGSRLGWSAKKTMREAQQLYEKGLITYHRTDSLNIAAEAITSARSYIKKSFGDDYLPEKPNYYRSKSKGAQEAHEAIRPTDPTKREVEVEQGADKLYKLIWERFIASQMMPAQVVKTTIRVSVKGKIQDYELVAQGERLKFDGWLKLNMKLVRLETQILPEINKGDELDLVKIVTEQKFTQPPARYSEASLIKVLEEKGIGRPSTYAPIISTIQLRNYVERKEKRLHPTVIGTTVTEFLDNNFKEIMDYEFTAEMEANLDKVAEGKQDKVKLLSTFYTPFEKKVEKVIEKAERVKIPVETTGDKCPICKKGDVVIRAGRFGKFLSCSDFPECKYTAPYKQVVKDVVCEECGGEVIVKKSRKGRSFYGCANYPKCKWASWTKPKKL